MSPRARHSVPKACSLRNPAMRSSRKTSFAISITAGWSAFPNTTGAAWTRTKCRSALNRCASLTAVEIALLSLSEPSVGAKMTLYIVAPCFLSILAGLVRHNETAWRSGVPRPLRHAVRSEGHNTLDHESFELPAIPDVGGREIEVFLVDEL